MTRAEFNALPVAAQVRLIMDAFPSVEERVLAMDAPRLPMPPKFDSRIRRKEGYQWASETDIDGLHYYHSRAAQGATSGSYAEKNAKEARGLEFWIRWREIYPTQVWAGDRNRVESVALPPASKPTVHQWEARGETGTTASTTSVNTRALDDDGPSGDDGYNLDENEAGSALDI